MGWQYAESESRCTCPQDTWLRVLHVSGQALHNLLGVGMGEAGLAITPYLDPSLRADLQPIKQAFQTRLVEPLLKEWSRVVKGVKARVLWVAAHHLPLPLRLSHTWRLLLPAIRDLTEATGKVARDEAEGLATSATKGVLPNVAAISGKLAGGTVTEGHVMEEGRHVALWVLERLVAAVDRGCAYFCAMHPDTFRVPAEQLEFGIPDPQQLHTLLGTLEEELRLIISCSPGSSHVVDRARASVALLSSVDIASIHTRHSAFVEEAAERLRQQEAAQRVAEAAQREAEEAERRAEEQRRQERAAAEARAREQAEAAVAQAEAKKSTWASFAGQDGKRMGEQAGQPGTPPRVAFASSVGGEFGGAGVFEDGAFGAAEAKGAKKGRSIFQRDALFDDDDDDDGFGGVAIGEGVEANLSGDDTSTSDTPSTGCNHTQRCDRGGDGHTFGRRQRAGQEAGPIAEAVASSAGSRLTSAPSSVDQSARLLTSAYGGNVVLPEGPMRDATELQVSIATHPASIDSFTFGAHTTPGVPPQAALFRYLYLWYYTKHAVHDARPSHATHVASRAVPAPTMTRDLAGVGGSPIGVVSRCQAPCGEVLTGVQDPLTVEMSHTVSAHVGRADLEIVVRHNSQLDLTGVVMEITLSGPAQLANASQSKLRMSELQPGGKLTWVLGVEVVGCGTICVRPLLQLPVHLGPLRLPRLTCKAHQINVLALLSPPPFPVDPSDLPWLLSSLPHTCTSHVTCTSPNESGAIQLLSYMQHTWALQRVAVSYQPVLQEVSATFVSCSSTYFPVIFSVTGSPGGAKNFEFSVRIAALESSVIVAIEEEQDTFVAALCGPTAVPLSNVAVGDVQDAGEVEVVDDLLHLITASPEIQQVLDAGKVAYEKKQSRRDEGLLSLDDDNEEGGEWLQNLVEQAWGLVDTTGL